MPDNADYYYHQLQAPVVSALSVEFLLLAPLAALGLVLGARRTHALELAAAYIGAGVAANVLFYTASRLRMPVVLALTPFAAFGLVSLLQSLAARRWRRSALRVVATGAVAALVARPLAPGRLVPRVADFGVANKIIEHLASRAAETGDRAGALRLLERQLGTEPQALATLGPLAGSTQLPVLSAAVAGSFAPLHELVGALSGNTAKRELHLRQAWLLREVAAQFERVQR